MIENVLKLVKSTVANSITGSANIPAAQQKQAIETTTTALTDGLKQNFTLGNMGNLASLFGGSSVSQSNPIVTSVQNTVSSALVSRLGLSKSIANSVSTTVVPMVINAISGKVNDPKDKSFSIESLIGAFAKSGGSSSAAGSILGGLGKLLGK